MINMGKNSFVSIIIGILILSVLSGLASASATPDRDDEYYGMDDEAIPIDLYSMIDICVQWLNENEEVLESTLTNQNGYQNILITVHPNNFASFVLSNGKIVDYKINEGIPEPTVEIEMDQDTFEDFFYAEGNNNEIFNRHFLNGDIIIHEINVSDVNVSNVNVSDVNVDVEDVEEAETSDEQPEKDETIEEEDEATPTPAFGAALALATLAGAYIKRRS